MVVPVYNSADSLPLLIDEVGRLLPQLAPEYELVLVNDGSADRSWRAIEELAAAKEWVTGINLMRNYGQHNALLCGIRAATYDVIVTIDDDLQNPPGEIPKLLAKLDDGYDVVYGVPERQQHGMFRDVASTITKIILSKAMGADVARNVNAFRAFRTQLRRAFADFRAPFVSIDVLLTWGTRRFAAVSVRHDERKIGASGYTLRKLFAHAMNMMTGFSTVPLQLASVIGFAFTLFGIGILIFVVVRYFLQGTPVPGFPFLASVIALFSGAQLFALGIHGEYIARMHTKILDQPPYAVASTTCATIREPDSIHELKRQTLS